MLFTGGWRDPYHDAVYRMVETLPCVRGIIGPWPHNWPDVGCPGMVSVMSYGLYEVERALCSECGLGIQTE